VVHLIFNVMNIVQCLSCEGLKKNKKLVITTSYDGKMYHSNIQLSTWKYFVPVLFEIQSCIVNVTKFHFEKYYS